MQSPFPPSASRQRARQNETALLASFCVLFLSCSFVIARSSSSSSLHSLPSPPFISLPLAPHPLFSLLLLRFLRFLFHRLVFIPFLLSFLSVSHPRASLITSSFFNSTRHTVFLGQNSFQTDLCTNGFIRKSHLPRRHRNCPSSR